MENLIVKCFTGYKKYLNVISTVLLITALILQALLLSSQILYETTVSTYEADCGLFDITLEGLTDDEISRVKAHKQVNDSCEYDIRYEIFNESEIPIIYADEEYLNFVPYTLIEGCYPQESGEIVIEPWFLRHLGIETEEMIGSKVIIGGQTYCVTGLIGFTGYSERAILVPEIITYKNNECSGIAIDLKVDISDASITAFLNEVQLNEGNVLSGRNADKEWAYENGDTATTPILWIVAIIVFAASMMLVYSLLCFFTKKAENDIQIMMHLGIRNIRISNGLFKCLLWRILLMNYIGAVIAVIGERYIASVILGINSGYRAHYLYIAIYFVLIAAMEILLTVGCVTYIFLNSYTRNAGKMKQKHIKPYQKKDDKVYFRMGRNNFRMASKVNLFTILTMALSISMVVSVNTYFECIRKSNIDYGDLTYRITFSDEYLLSEDEIEKKNHAIDGMLSDRVLMAETRNIYFTTMQVKKDELSEAFRAYLCNFSDIKNLMDNQLTETIPVPVGVMSFSEISKICDIDMNNGMLLFTKLYNMDQVDGVSIKADQAQFAICGPDGYEQCTCTLENTFVPDKIYTNDVFMLAAVDDHTFDRLSGGQGVSTVYVYGDVTDAYLYEYLRDIDSVKVETGQELIMYSQSGMNSIIKILIFLCFICVVSLLLNFLITSMLRANVYKKEYVRLISIGIPFTSIARVIGYETLLLFVPTAALSGGVTYLIYRLLKKTAMDSMGVYRLEFPGGTFMVLILMLFMVMAFAAWFAIRNLYKITVKQNDFRGSSAASCR